MRSECLEKDDLFNEMRAETVAVEMNLLPVKLDNLLRNLLLLSFAALLEERMLEAFIYRESEVRVADEDLMKEINSFLTCARVDCSQI